MAEGKITHKKYPWVGKSSIVFVEPSLLGLVEPSVRLVKPPFGFVEQPFEMVEAPVLLVEPHVVLIEPPVVMIEHLRHSKN